MRKIILAFHGVVVRFRCDIACKVLRTVLGPQFMYFE